MQLRFRNKLFDAEIFWNCLNVFLEILNVRPAYLDSFCGCLIVRNFRGKAYRFALLNVFNYIKLVFAVFIMNLSKAAVFGCCR